MRDDARRGPDACLDGKLIRANFIYIEETPVSKAEYAAAVAAAKEESSSLSPVTH
ncbi:MAG: hypothetical protein WB783_03620 [Arenicellales bacterium]